MKIVRAEIKKLQVPLRVPFKTALRRVDAVEDVVLALYTDTGAVGYGEAPPTGVITGDTFLGIVGALKAHILPAIMNMEVADLDTVTSAIAHSVLQNHSAKAAADMAVWDLYGQMLQTPVYQLLGGGRQQITTDITISVNPPDMMAKDAVYAVQSGYDCLKVKVGLQPELDVERLSAIRRAVGGEIRIRIDANQAWTPRQAVRILASMQDRGLGIELVEQPVKAEDIDGLKYVTDHSDVPVLADESVFSARDAIRIMERHAADLVNIKLMKCGGITEALRIVSAAEVYGVECMLGCMLEGSVSVNAAASLAAAKRQITKIDLDGPGLCTKNPVIGGADFDGKTITVSDAPGFGITGLQEECVAPLE
ncbi:MAG: dipeptide epimerase [Clostridia bacterium]|nr:dipeptide epimerase [Clostridia bacterium]